MKINNIDDKNLREDFQVCEEHCLHKDIVESARIDIPSDKKMQELSELFKVLGDGTRIKIIYALFENEMCVCDIAEFLGMTQSAISHQLRVLKNTRLVKNRKEGKTVFYSLDDDHVRLIFNCGLSHIQEIYV